MKEVSAFSGFAPQSDSTLMVAGTLLDLRVSEPRLELLAISHTFVVAMNRTPYRLMLAGGRRVELLCPERLPGDRGHVRLEAPAAGEPPIHTRVLEGTGPRTWRYRGLRRFLDEKKPTRIVIDSEPGSVLGVETANWAVANDAKVFCLSCENLQRTARASFQRGGGRALLAALATRMLSALSMPAIGGVFVLSEEGRRCIRSLGFEHVCQIPLGFDPSAFRPSDKLRSQGRDELGLTGVVVSFMGRMVRNKGVHRIVDALAEMRELPWTLLLDSFSDAADTDYAKEVEARILELGLEDRVQTFDANHKEIPRYLNAIDILVVASYSSPTFFEQYGRIVAEGLACGKLVIVSDCGALPEVAGAHAVVFPERDDNALRDALRKGIVEKGWRNSRGAAGAVDAKKRLSVERQVRLMEKAIFCRDSN